ncbi:MAG: protein kinase, partial [Acidobacteriota bacterium]
MTYFDHISERYATAVPLASGATSEVYRAYDKVLGRDVALKLLRQRDAASVARMSREAEVQARLRHPSICTIYDVGTYDDGRPYIAMELIEGRELGHPSVQTLDLRTKLGLIADMARGVQVAHAAGLVHRDIKPSNVMVETRPDGGLRPVIVDFGLVQESRGATLSEGASWLGTPAFMAPEQVATGPKTAPRTDARTDVYGLGATLYTLLAGHPPYQGKSLEVVMALTRDDPPSLRRRMPTLPSDVATIVETCMARDPGKRYPSAAALADDLDRCRSGAPIRAQRVGRIERARVQLHRSPRLRRVLAVSAALLIAAVAVLAWVQLRADAAAADHQYYSRIARDLAGSLRAERMSAQHDIRPARAKLEQRLVELANDPRRDVNPGPRAYALGRGALALRDYDQAHRALQRAWDAGYRHADVAYALGLTYAYRYADAVSAIVLGDRGNRSARDVQRVALRDAAQTLRDRAYDYLDLARRERAGASISGASGTYLDALLASYASGAEGGDDSLRRAETAIDTALAAEPWRYEIHLLRADLYARRGAQALVEGAFDAADAHYARAESAYDLAASSAASDALTHLGVCQAAGRRVRIDTERNVPHAVTRDHHARAAQACKRALAIDPDRLETQIALGNAGLYWAQYEHYRVGTDPAATLQRTERQLRTALARARGGAVTPGIAALHDVLGSVLFMTGRFAVYLHQRQDPRPYYDQAHVHHRIALHALPDDPLIRLNLGHTLKMRIGQEVARDLDPAVTTRLAVDALEQVLVYNPDNVRVIATLADAHRIVSFHQHSRGRDFGEASGRAAAYFERALALRPDHPGVLASYARARYVQAVHAALISSDHETLMRDARDAAARAVALQPEHAGLHYDEFLVHYHDVHIAMLRGQSPARGLEAARDALANLERLSGSGYRADVAMCALLLETMTMRDALARGVD